MEMHMIPLESIRIDGGTLARVDINTAVVDEYAEMIDLLPPIIVYFDGSHHWLADGFHRYHAARKAGMIMIRADVRDGNLDDARWFATSANKAHGLRRTNADKRKAVVAALRLRPNHSDRAIAEHVGVSSPTVGLMRLELASTENLVSSANRISRDGHIINTTNIGRGVGPHRRNSAPAAMAPTITGSYSTGNARKRRPRMSEAPAVQSPDGLDRHPSVKAILLRMDMLVNMPLSQISQLALIEAMRNLKSALALVL